MKRSGILVGSLVAWLGLTAGTASADPATPWQYPQLAKPGVTLVGMIGNVAYTVTQPQDGSACTFAYMGVGGLDRSTTIMGTSGDDTVILVTANNASWCGYSMQPLIRRGMPLSISAGNGNDFLWIGDLSWASGGGHDDAIVDILGGGNSSLMGDSGNDLLHAAGRTSDRLHGGYDNDALCALFSDNNASVQYMDGGPGFDTQCGWASAGFYGIEAPDCNRCAF